ncbi:hypothetical protein ACU686_26315 [Yinghuangia aomiensis]
MNASAPATGASGTDTGGAADGGVETADLAGASEGRADGTTGTSAGPGGTFT